MSWPLFKMISGATYSGVPQKVHVFFPNPIFLAKPKSTWGKEFIFFLSLWQSWISTLINFIFILLLLVSDDQLFHLCKYINITVDFIFTLWHDKLKELSSWLLLGQKLQTPLLQEEREEWQHPQKPHNSTQLYFFNTINILLFANLRHSNVIWFLHCISLYSLHSQKTQKMWFMTFFVPLLLSYQFGIAPVVQYEVLWFEVSVNDSFGMQVGEGLHHTSCVKPGSWVLKWTPGNTGGQQSWTVIFVASNNCGSPAEPSFPNPTRRFALCRIPIF